MATKVTKTTKGEARMTRMSRRGVLVAVTAAIGWAAAAIAQPAGTLVYVGTYTGQKSKGIYAFRFDQTSGALTPVGLVAETKSPSWLALHPSGRFLYAANETDDYDDAKSGAVSAYAIDSTTGALTHLSTQSSRGAHPCHLSIDKSGTHLIVANYTGGNLAVLPIGADGKLGPATQVVQHAGSSVNSERQKGPHAHSVDFDAGGQFAVSSDLGADSVFVYKYDATGGRLSAGLHPAVAAQPGAGPRHFAFHPNGRFGFAINELSSTITSYAWDGQRGALKTMATVPTLPRGQRGSNSTAEIRVHPGGRFLYGSNRGHDSIAVYAVNPATGGLTLVEHELTRGKTPRNFTIDPTGTWLIAANQGSDSLAVFRINTKDGSLTAAGGLTSIGSPVSIVFAHSTR